VGVSITNPGVGYTFTNPPIVVFDSPISYDNIPLNYSSSSVSGFGTGATISVVVGQGSSVINFEIQNTGKGYGSGEILTIPTGGTTGIPTDPSKPFSEFNVTIQNTFSDEFTGWSLGTLQVLDNIEELFDGLTRTFALKVAGNLVSIRSSRGSKINVQDVLLVFVNDILQVPGEGYTFTGGSVLTFSEAPKEGDTCRIIFYKGSGDVDVVLRNIIETVKIGDELTIGYDRDSGQATTLQEDPRTVTSVDSTDIVSTMPYFGPGNTEDESLSRIVTWCRQTEDKIIDEKMVGKDRELYEPVIFPFAYITKSVGIGSTHIYVDRIRPLFNSQNENDTSLLFQNKIRFAPQEEKVSAAATAVVSGFGTISSLVISTGGVGYSTSPTVSIGGTLQQVGGGTTATASATISSGSVSALTITNPGVGYTHTNPPVVLISPPTYEEEENNVSSFSGDSGIIVGFGTTTVGGGTTQFVFDLHIPYDSPLRNTTLVGTAQTISTINVNDYFVVTDSNVGIATTSIISLDNISGETAGVGTFHIDNVYVVQSVEFVERTLTGIGTTSLRRVFVNVSDSFSFGSGIATSPYFGSFSWGKFVLPSRAGLNSYTAYTQNGVVGINTSVRVERSAALKFKNYLL
jgi:hypothetical protein